MARKKKHEEHENLERWLVSYADFITLLFATFVVLYALSQIDIASYTKLEDSIRKAFAAPSVIMANPGLMSDMGATILAKGGDFADQAVIPPILEYLSPKYEDTSFEELKEEIKKLVDTNKLSDVEVMVSERGLVISLKNSLLFNSGSAQIRKSSHSELYKIGRLLSSKFLQHHIRVEGHTDNIDLNSSQYPSNWELSSARASSVVRYFIENFPFNKSRFAAIGYADSKPIAPNDTEEGRERNRRVEIVIMRNKFAQTEPMTASPFQPKAKEKTLDELKRESVSDAAKNLAKETGTSIKDVLMPEDSYDKEGARFAKELKDKENKVRKEYNLTETYQEEPTSILKESKVKVNKAENKNDISKKVEKVLNEPEKMLDTSEKNKEVVEKIVKDMTNPLKVYPAAGLKSSKEPRSVKIINVKSGKPSKSSEPAKAGQVNDAVKNLIKENKNAQELLIINN